MITNLIFLAAFFVSLFFLARSTLIVLGVLKAPIIQGFEKYGPDEDLYFPLLPFMAWSGVFIITFGVWLSSYLRLSFALSGLGLVLLFMAGLAYHDRDLAIRWNDRFIKFPRWYHELRDRTDRYERRRIAYMWLHLPWKLRLIYNSSDRAFFNWADFVIMGTTMDEEEDPNKLDKLYTGGW